MLTKMAAQGILEAFGPNSEVYECNSVGDIIEAAGDDPQDFVRGQMNRFDVYTDRESEAAYEMEAAGHREKVKTELTAMRAAIVKRLNALGYVVM